MLRRILSPGRSVPVLLLCLSLGQAAVAESEDDNGVPTNGAEHKVLIRIGILHKDTPTGNRHAEGIAQAIRTHALHASERVNIVPVSYSKEDDGVELLLHWVTRPVPDSGKSQAGESHGTSASPKPADTSPPQADENQPDRRPAKKLHDDVDIVIGPTESGVFVQAMTRMRQSVREGTRQGAGVPAISGLVASRVANDPDGWFFRTNVDAAKRADTIYNFINKYWVRSIAVLYADTEYATRAEHEFQKLLTPEQRKHYTSVLYEDPPNVSTQLRTIFAERPEMIGFFGEREDIQLIYRTIPEINPEMMSFRPLFFTLLDARCVADNVDQIDLYCVTICQDSMQAIDRMTPRGSVSLDGGNKHDEVRFLGYETGLIVMEELNEIVKDLRADQEEAGKTVDAATALKLTSRDIRKFRDRFATFLSQSGPRATVRSTFTNMQNSTQRNIIRVTKQPGAAAHVQLVENDQTAGLLAKMGMKIRLIHGSFGGWPVLCIGLILLLSAVLSGLDLSRWFQGSNLNVWGTGFFFVYTAFHALLVVLLYVTLAETGAIRYDNVAMAVALCFAPTAMLRTTFFETKRGKMIGLEGVYRAIRANLDYRVMKARHRALQAKKNLIAYSNSVFVMRRALVEIYRNHPSPAEAGRLIQELEEVLRSEQDYFDRRRKCAYRLLRQLGWEQIKADGFVSAKWIRARQPGKPGEHAPDGQTADAQTSDGRVPDGQAPDAQTSDTLTPDRDVVTHDGRSGNGLAAPEKAAAWDSDDLIPDPRMVVAMAVKYCLRSRERREKLKEEVEGHLEGMQSDSDQRSKELRAFYDAECEKALAPESIVNIRVRFLLVLLSFDVEELIAKDFLTQQQVDGYRRELKQQTRTQKQKTSPLLVNYVTLAWCGVRFVGVWSVAQSVRVLRRLRRPIPSDEDDNTASSDAEGETPAPQSEVTLQEEGEMVTTSGAETGELPNRPR
jgi:hypothetical protein